MIVALQIRSRTRIILLALALAVLGQSRALVLVVTVAEGERLQDVPIVLRLPRLRGIVHHRGGTLAVMNVH